MKHQQSGVLRWSHDQLNATGRHEDTPNMLWKLLLTLLTATGPPALDEAPPLGDYFGFDPGAHFML